MENKRRRVLSFTMSAIMLLTNMISPMKAFAGEAAERATENRAEETVVPETEPVTESPRYILTLPYYEEVSYETDNERIFRPENDSLEDLNVYLAYRADENAPRV